ncbi:MAG: DNA mismatch repair endonuclease MutL [Beggiatoa sp.]|nr:DNA mismatch repair endonuclease MutL [Beggiatoa sp.]
MPTGPRRIKTLPEVVINQIAAGEVVERPASVVKELVENSLDAGADEVLVDVEDGGCRLIRVRDNGAGIEAEDLPLALSRHATSKIGGLDDLVSLASLGFRGEALPSIGSISTLMLSSRVRASEAGWTIRTTGGMGTVGPLPTPHPPGTSVEVRDLFFNTPARRKFLRSERTELQQIQDWLRRLALGRVEVRFSLHHNRRNFLNVRKAAGPLDIAERLRELGGAPLTAAVAVDETAAAMRLRGWIWRAPALGNGQEIKYLYVNGRAVRDRAVQHALWTAAEHSDCTGQFAAYLLYLDMDPADVDVNVHPQKLEIRFLDGRSVHDFVLSAAKRALAGAGSVAPLSQSTTGSRARIPPIQSVREAPGAYHTAARPRLSGPAAARAGRGVALVGARYLITMDAAGVTVIDGAVAFCRLFAEWARRGPAVTRTLLIPERLDLGKHAIDTLEGHAALLGRMGLDLEPAGSDALLVRGVPAPLHAADYEAVIRDVVTLLAGRSTVPEPDAGLPAVLAAHALCSASVSSPEALWDTLRDLAAIGYGEGGTVAPGLRRLTDGDLARLVCGGIPEDGAADAP